MRLIEFNKLLHISFNNKLEGVWHPKLPESKDSRIMEGYSEPDMPRICVAPTIKQCFWAIYPNISHLIDTGPDEKWHDEIYFCVYEPIYSQIKSIIGPNELSQKQWVHDAHMTDEHWILNSVYMKKINEINIKNPSKTEYQIYRPYNKKTEKENQIGPKNINYYSILNKNKLMIKEVSNGQ